MFTSNDNHLLHRNGIKLVREALDGAIDITNYPPPYNIEWRNIKLIVKVAKMSKKSNQRSAKWFYNLGVKDYEIVDYFILLAIANGKLGALYVLPKLLSPKRYITITKLNGNVRYDYFKTDIGGLGEKILKLQVNLPKLVNVYREAKFLKGE